MTDEYDDDQVLSVVTDDVETEVEETSLEVPVEEPVVEVVADLSWEASYKILHSKIKSMGSLPTRSQERALQKLTTISKILKGDV